MKAADRIETLWSIIGLGAAIVAIKLFDLQVMEHAAYWGAAERNRVQVIYETAPRGRFFDRNGVLLASNRLSFALVYFPRDKAAETELASLSRALARELRVKPGDILDKLKEAQKEATTIRLAEDIPLREMFRLSELKVRYPGLYLVHEAQRDYPDGSLAGHLLGYLGKMEPKAWRQFKRLGYRIDSRVGRFGLEKVFEDVLRGQDGGIDLEVDARGRLQRILGRREGAPGNDVYLTIDAAVERAASEGLAATPTRRGAAVAIDPGTGALLALVSAPEFDPGDFLAKEAAPGKVSEFDRAISGTYPPGSTFKIVVGAAGLNENKFNTTDKVLCKGSFELGDKIFLCWKHTGHGLISWFRAVAQSCDVYFYEMGLRTGPDLIEDYERRFGFGSKTGVSLPGEAAGKLAGPDVSPRGRGRWRQGDTVNLSIGQGGLLATPLQLADMVAAVSRRGERWRPYYTDRIVYAGELGTYRQKPHRLGTIELKPQVWADLETALALVVSSGTALAAAVPGLDVRGKTGTAQNPHGRDHAWFVGYASRPGKPARIAVAVLVENGGHGGSVAAPIAREMFKAAFRAPAKSS